MIVLLLTNVFRWLHRRAVEEEVSYRTEQTNVKLNEVRRRLRLDGQQQAWTKTPRELFPLDLGGVIPLDSTVYSVVFHLGERYVSCKAQRSDVNYDDSICVAKLGDLFVVAYCVAFFTSSTGDLSFVVSPLRQSTDLFSALRAQIHPRDIDVVSMFNIIEGSGYLCGGTISNELSVWDSSAIIGHAAKLLLCNGSELFVNLAFRAFSQ